MSNVPFPFLIFAGFVIILWIICLSLRLRAGSRSSRAVRELEDYSEKMLARNRRIDAINDIFREVIRGQKPADSREIRAYMIEYADYANRYQQDQDRWVALLEAARNELENLRISQNMLKGRNDLAAIPYYTRCDRYNKLVSRYNLNRKANFNAELARQVSRLIAGAPQTV